MFKKSLIAVIMSALLLTSTITVSADTDVDAEGTNKTSYEVSGTTVGSQTTERTETFDLPIPDYYGEDKYDTAGNLSLVKEQKIIYDSSEMQFIAVTTKDGHIFYILIDYTAIEAAENGEEGADARETVYFLNKVDDYDLFTLLYDDSDEDGNNAYYQMLGSSSSEPDSDIESEDEEEESSTSKSSGIPLWALMLGTVAVIGGAYYFIKIRGKKKQPIEDDDFDFEDEDEEINEDEE